MTFRCLLVSLLVLAFSAADCSRTAHAQTPACSPGRSCQISGIAANQSSGHGMISHLRTDDGRCFNVSLPDDVSAGLEQDGQVRMTVRGDVVAYPKGDGVMEFLVDDRSVGQGECGREFLFVATTGDVCVGEDDQCRQNGFSSDKPRANKPHKVKAVLQD
jgi:hypothetical protein